jgi:CRISPR-associated exonuclease Cas4
MRTFPRVSACCTHGRARRVFDPEFLPVSALNHLLYCERRCALIHIEGVFVENAHTLAGRFAHEHADTPGYETRAGIRAVRALPIFSDLLGLSGKADIVEFHPNSRGLEQPVPVEYKRGSRKRWDNDDVQLCAQALCLEEMVGIAVPFGAVFYARTKRRRDVQFTDALRRQTREAIDRLRRLIITGKIPPALLKPQCDGCSLHEACMPEAAARTRQIEGALHLLFAPEE